jgi:hypothetical protein
MRMRVTSRPSKTSRNSAASFRSSLRSELGFAPRTISLTEFSTHFRLGRFHLEEQCMILRYVR